MWLVYICNSAITPGVRHFAFQQYVGLGATTGFVLTVTFVFMSGWVIPKPKARIRETMAMRTTIRHR